MNNLIRSQRRDLVRLRDLEKAVVEYLNEVDNPAPDFTMRRILRERLRELAGVPLPQPRDCDHERASDELRTQP